MKLKSGEEIEKPPVRFRTLGCYPLTGAIDSDANTLEGIVTRCHGAHLPIGRAPDRQRREVVTGEEKEGRHSEPRSLLDEDHQPGRERFGQQPMKNQHGAIHPVC